MFHIVSMLISQVFLGGGEGWPGVCANDNTLWVVKAQFGLINIL